MTGATTSVHALQRGAAEDVAVAGSTILAQPSARSPAAAAAAVAAAAAAAAAPVGKDRKGIPPAVGPRSQDTCYKHVSNLSAAFPEASVCLFTI